MTIMDTPVIEITAPLISVVLPTYNVAQYLRDTYL